VRTSLREYNWNSYLNFHIYNIPYNGGSVKDYFIYFAMQTFDYQRLSRNRRAIFASKLVLVVVAVVDVLILLTEFEESELVLEAADFVAKRNLVALAEISGLKVNVEVRDVAFDF